MTTPSADDERPDRVDLGKSPAAQDQPDFDPYRFGKPDHPIPPEYAPPGYTPDPPAHTGPGVYPPAPYGQNPYGQSPYGQPGAAPHGQQPYGAPGQGPYGAYPPPPYPNPYAPQQPQGSNGKAVTALVLGIGSVVFCWLSFFALVLIVPALVFGILGLGEAKRRGGNGRGMAVAGIACAAAGAVLAAVLTVVIVNAADKCGGLENSDDPGFQQCVQDNL